MKKITVSALAVLTALSGFTPAWSAPVAPLVKPTITSEVETVQYRYRPRPGWYHGHRGYRTYRRGYRRHSDGWWYPLAAFGAGALIGGAIASQPRPAQAGINPRHYEWCAARYRTYRASDNTYVPRVGVRAQCNSPYY
jgi:hypothetical protein